MKRHKNYSLSPLSERDERKTRERETRERDETERDETERERERERDERERENNLKSLMIFPICLVITS